MLLPVFECGDLRENRFKLMTLGKIVKYCKKDTDSWVISFSFSLSLLPWGFTEDYVCAIETWQMTSLPPSPSKKKKKKHFSSAANPSLCLSSNCCFSLNLRWRTNRWTGQGTSRERKRNAGQRVRTKQHRKTVRRERSKRPRRETRVSISLV